jgi:hypothetical protein
VKSIETWLERSEEFPTPADLVNLIKRNGKPPLRESDIVVIRKKDGADRTRAEWYLLAEWDAQAQEGWGSDYRDEQKESATLQENIRLRTELRELRAECGRLAELLRRERQQKSLPVPAVPLQDKVQRTVDAMRAGGAPQADIDEFLRQYEAV